MSLGLCCLALLQVSCADEPSCVPGQSISCACVQGTQGAQVCAPSGRQYLPCVCLSDVAQLGEPSATRATFEGRTPASVSALESPSPAVSELKASALNSAHSSSAAPLKRSSSVALVSDDPLKAEDETIELAPIELSRATVKAPKNPQMSRQWWLALEREKRCDLKDDINSEHHPAQLLAQGCYIRVRQGAQMKIKCDAAPFGPHTFQYSEREEDCLALMRSQAREQSSDVLRDEAPQSAHASARPKRRDPREVKASEPEGRDWYCMCYQELFQGQASDSTACRRDLESCRDLEQKVLEGSPVLVKNSMSVACKRYQAQEPWDRFGVRYQWLPSSQPGAWWTPRGCFLNPQAAQRRRAQLGAQLKSRAHSTASTRSPSSKRSSKGSSKRSIQPAAPLAELSSPEPRSCEAACWANLADDEARLRRFKQREVPSALTWGAPYAAQVGLIMKTCLVRNRNQGRSSYEKECFQGSLKACTKRCERDQSP